MNFSVNALLQGFSPKPPGKNYAESMGAMRPHRLNEACGNIDFYVSRFKDEAFNGQAMAPEMKKLFLSGYHEVKNALSAARAIRLVNGPAVEYIENALDEIKYGLGGLREGVSILQNDHSSMAEFWREASIRLDALTNHLLQINEQRQHGLNREDGGRVNNVPAL